MTLGEPVAGDTCPSCYEGRLIRKNSGKQGSRLECDNCGSFFNTSPDDEFGLDMNL